MKFSHAAVATMLAASATAQAIPEMTETTAQVDKRVNADEVIGALQHLADVLQSKRDVDGSFKEAELVEMLKRDIDWAGIFQSVISYLPTLIKAVWDSGIIQNIASAIWNSGVFKDLLSKVGSWVLDFIKSIFTPKAADPATGKRELDENLAFLNELSERDLIDSLGSIIGAIWNSGVIQNVFNWVINWIKTNPETFQNILNQALSFVGSIAGQLWTWLQESGLITKLFDWLGANIGNILLWVGKLISSLLGGATTPAPAAAPAAPKKRREVRMY